MRRERMEEWCALAAVAAAFVHGASYSWLRWGDVLVDSGMVLAWPRRVLDGALLYRDLHYPYGPLDVYVNAALYAVLGVRTETVFAAGLACAAGAAAALYALCRSVLRPWPSALAAAFFIYACAFGHLSGYGGYNFVLPYAASATYGTTAALGSLALLAAWRRSRRPHALAGSCLLLAATALSKVEVFGALSAAHACAWALSPRGARRQAAAHYGAALLAAAVVYAFFAWKAGASVLVMENLSAPQHRQEAAQLALSGLDAAGRNLGLAGLSLGATAVVLGLAYLPLFVLPRGGKGTAWAARALSAVAACGAWGLAGSLGPALGFRCLPLLALLMLGWRFLGRLSAGERDSFDDFLPALVFGLLMAARIALRCSAAHYGFFLLAPGLALYHYALLGWAPAALGLKARLGWRHQLPVTLFLLVLGWRHAEASRAGWGAHTVELDTPRGRWRVRGGNAGLVLKETEAFLRARTPDCASVAAVPEGIALAFLSGRRWPHPHYAYLPNAVPDPETAAGLFEREAPDFVVSLPRDLSEFGYRRFDDFAPALAAGLGASYQVEAVIASAVPPGPPYRAVVLRRR